jgi:hypothetical protein
MMMMRMAQNLVVSMPERASLAATGSRTTMTAQGAF